MVLLLLVILLLPTFFLINSRKTADTPGKLGLGSTALLEQSETNKVNSNIGLSEKKPIPTVKQSVSKDITTPDPKNESQTADRIWGKVIATSENKLFNVKIYANAVCQIVPNISSGQYYSKNGADPVRPQHGTNWPSGIGIKIRKETGEILGVKSGFSTGWMNPNWGGSGHLITDEIVPMYSDGLDLSELMKRLIPRISGELEDTADMSQLEFKLKIFTSTASILKSDGTAVPPADRDDFESEWISGRYLEAKP